MKVAIASDHAGFNYKELIKIFLQSRGIVVQDFGSHSNALCDYPDFIIPAAKAVRDKLVDRGIVLGGSGNGEAIAANRIAGVRCCVCWNIESAELARRHNDSNVISLGERMIY